MFSNPTQSASTVSTSSVSKQAPVESSLFSKRPSGTVSSGLFAKPQVQADDSKIKDSTKAKDAPKKVNIFQLLITKCHNFVYASCIQISFKLQRQSVAKPKLAAKASKKFSSPPPDLALAPATTAQESSSSTSKDDEQQLRAAIRRQAFSDQDKFEILEARHVTLT